MQLLHVDAAEHGFGLAVIAAGGKEQSTVDEEVVGIDAALYLLS